MRRLVIDSDQPFDASLAERLSDCGCRVVTAIGAAAVPDPGSVHSPGIFVAVATPDGARIQAANASFRETLGHASESISGLPIEQILSSRVKCPSAFALVEAIRSCQPYVGSAVISDANGASHLVVARVFPILDESDPKCVGIVEWIQTPRELVTAPIDGAPPDAGTPDRSKELRAKGITNRERQIVEGIAGRGLSIKQIAFEFSISPHTVRNHLRSIYSKLDIGSQVELVRWYASKSP
ncbi:MAG: PAS and helix-turn-helix domain-containing protein [Planctomycetes bacterium]|nr:PAS and helix-turn-helix domain-containing protein [Planctomycetota bacterium]